jgi:hypothetical protein
MAKMKTVEQDGGGYNADEIGAMSWEAFKADADLQTAANKSAWFGEWGNQRETKLHEVHDAAVAKIASGMPAPQPDPPPAKETGGKGANKGNQPA